MNENECGKAEKVIGMKKYVRISRFPHFKRLRDRPTDRPTDRLDLLKKCEDALKKWKTRVFYTLSVCSCVRGGLGCGWGLNAPVHPSATIS